MAGYSGTPLPKKLGIKEGARVALIQAPAGFGATLGELPPHVAVAETGSPPPGMDVILYFTRERAELAAAFSGLAAALQPAGGLWIAWPKKASKVPTDLTEDVIRGIGLAAGLVDNKVCAVDETWSGLRFVYRVKDRT